MVSKRALKIAILLLKAAHHNLYTYDALWCTWSNSYNHENILVYHLQYILSGMARGVLIGPFDPPWLWKDPFAALSADWRKGEGEKRTQYVAVQRYTNIWWSHFIWSSIWMSQTMFSSDIWTTKSSAWESGLWWWLLTFWGVGDAKSTGHAREDGSCSLEKGIIITISNQSSALIWYVGTVICILL